MSSDVPRTPDEYRRWWEANARVPYGRCWCGCGGKTSIAAQTYTSRLQVKGEPIRFIPGHRGGPAADAAGEARVAEYREWWELNAPVPFGFCWCGCGERTPPAKQTDTKSGRIAGQPVRYLRRHVHRKLPEAREPEIVRAYEGGMTGYEVAQQFGTTPTTVSAILKRHGVSARPARMFTPAEEADICQKYAAGKTAPELGNLYGCTHNTILKVVKRNGGETRSNYTVEETFAPEQEAEVYRRYLAGQSLELLAESFGASTEAVRLSLRRSSFQPQFEIPFAVEQQAAAHRRYLAGESVEAVASALEMPHSIVRVVLRCNGIEPEDAPLSQEPRDEATLRDRLADHLRRHGMRVQTELRTLAGGRIDIAAGDGGRLQIIVEVKVADPVRGIGQLFAYRVGRHPKPTMALALPADFDWTPLYGICREAEVELWLVEENGAPHKLCEALHLTYPATVVPSAFEDMWIAR